MNEGGEIRASITPPDGPYSTNKTIRLVIVGTTDPPHEITEPMAASDVTVHLDDGTLLVPGTRDISSLPGYTGSHPAYGIPLPAGAESTYFRTHTENYAPWSLYGDTDGAITGATLPAGAYTLSATAYPQANGAGGAMHTVEVAFTENGSRITSELLWTFSP